MPDIAVLATRLILVCVTVALAYLGACVLVRIVHSKGYVEPPPQYREKLYDMLSIVDRILTEHRIPYWIEAGTLLGAVRHRDIIPWDSDVDIVVPAEYAPALEEEEREKQVVSDLRRNGLITYPAGFGRSIRFADESFLSKASSLGVAHLVLLSLRWRRANWVWKIIQSYLHRFIRWPEFPYIDIFYKRDCTDRYEFVSQWAEKTWPGQSAIYKKETHPLRRYSFGPIQIWGPSNPEPYLDRAYGDWRVGRVQLGHGAPRYCNWFGLFLKKTVSVDGQDGRP